MWGCVCARARACLRACVRACGCVCVGAPACARARVRACSVRVRVRAHVRARACVHVVVHLGLHTVGAAKCIYSCLASFSHHWGPHILPQSRHLFLYGACEDLDPPRLNCALAPNMRRAYHCRIHDILGKQEAPVTLTLHATVDEGR